MSFLLRRTDQGGGWVAKSGSPGSYTHKLQHARRFETRYQAERERCVENEVIELFEHAIGHASSMGWL